MIGSAFLRVFLPIELLPPDERVEVEISMARGDHRVQRERTYRHIGRPAGRLGLLEASPGGWDVRSEDGRWYACPARIRLRVLAALISLRETAAAEVADELVPEIEARRAARELARLRRRDPGAVPTQLESPWHVPVRWFVLFRDEERRLEERDHGGYSIRYWTEVRLAAERVRRAARVLQATDLAPVATMVRDLDAWLSSFEPACAVELDYDDVTEGVSWNELDEDHSAREIQESLDALEAGDLERAGDLYRTVAARWAEAKIRESLN